MTGAPFILIMECDAERRWLRVNTRREVIARCMALPNVYEDYPFDDPGWTVMRHSGSRKSFAHIFERNGKIWINVKAEPMKCIFWRDAFSSVVPAYHMNKRHWISVILDGGMTDEDINMLIEDSYRLTRK